MACNCNNQTHEPTCSQSKTLSGLLSFKLDGATLAPFIGNFPLEPIDLTDAIQDGETNTRLRLDAQNEALVYSNERSVSGDLTEDVISLETLSKLIPLSGLKDVSYNGVSGGDLLVFNIQTQVWEPVSVNDDDLVSVIGYNSEGRLAKGESSGGGGGGGSAERPTYSVATAESVVPDPTTYGQYSFTALATSIVIGSPGVNSDGKVIIFRFRDNGTARALNWNAIYRGIGVTIPTATTTNKVLYVGAKYNAQDNKWDVLAVNRQA